MSAVKIISIVVLVLSVHVICWTVDIAEMNKLNSEMEARERSEEIVEELNEEERMKNDLNDEYHTTNYAEDLEYQSYMEKRIHGVLNNGSIYLDGLRKAMAHYRETLENCTTLTTTSAPSTWLPENDPRNQTDEDKCRSVLAASDQVTKLSELALWATNELRERKFAKNKDTAQDDEEELLVKLAWFLDQLAHLTGYTPDAADFQTTPDPVTESTSTTEDISTTFIPDTTSNLEIMQSVENGPLIAKLAPTHLTSVKNVHKRSVDETTNLVKNYIKHKVWQNVNIANDIDKSNDPFDVQNDLNVKPIQKRSVPTKKVIIMRAVTSKHLTKLKNNALHTKRYSRLMKKYGGATPKNVRKLEKTKLQKRSVYYNDVISRIPENPMQDLSYYVKSKPGTMIRPSLYQEDNVYQSVRDHFDVNNFEAVKRFGANVTFGKVALTIGMNKALADH